MDTVAPSVAEGLYLLRLAGDVLGISVFYVATGGRPLEVGVELDAVGRVEVDALHLPAQPFALGQRRHHLQAVAQDHAVRPVGVVAVKLGAGVVVRQAVEVGEQIELVVRRLLSRLAAPQQVVDQHLRVDLLLDEQRRRLNDEVGPVLLVLASPDELRVEVAVAALVRHLDGALVGLLHHRLVLRRGDVLARRLVVGDGFDPPGSFRHLRRVLARRVQQVAQRGRQLRNGVLNKGPDDVVVDALVAMDESIA